MHWRTLGEHWQSEKLKEVVSDREKAMKGGPDGWQKSSTKGYGGGVQAYVVSEIPKENLVNEAMEAALG